MAFTLLELSIVLLVIGLLVGGILTGQSLIHAADLRNQVKQLQEYQVAFATFQGKFDCIPGDCANATKFFGTTDNFGNAVNNGDGNSSIDTSTGTSFITTSYQTFANSPEMGGAFQELAAAKMISFTPTNPTSYMVGVSHPSAALNTQGGIFFGASYNFQDSSARSPSLTSYQTGSNALWLEHCTSTASPNIDVWNHNCAIFTASDLQALDSKIDDGKPISGKLFGFGGALAPNNCVSGSAGSYTYNTTITTQQCEAAYVIN